MTTKAVFKCTINLDDVLLCDYTAQHNIGSGELYRSSATITQLQLFNFVLS